MGQLTTQVLVADLAILVSDQNEIFDFHWYWNYEIIFLSSLFQSVLLLTALETIGAAGGRNKIWFQSEMKP